MRADYDDDAYDGECVDDGAYGDGDDDEEEGEQEYGDDDDEDRQEQPRKGGRSN